MTLRIVSLFQACLWAVPIAHTQQAEEAVQGAEREPRIVCQWIENGDFEQGFDADAEARLGTGVAWWRTLSGTPRVQRAEGIGNAHLVLPPGGGVSQAAAFYAANDLRLTARVRGRGAIVLRSAASVARFEFGAAVAHDGVVDDWRELDFDAAEIEARFGSAPQPRLMLELRATDAAAVAFDDVHLAGSLPAPAPGALRDELVTYLEWCFGLWIERGLDTFGEQSSAFVVRSFDAVTGEPLEPPVPGGVHVLFELLLDATTVVERDDWEAALGAHIEDLLTLGVHSESGLPVLWDGISDAPLPRRPFEVARRLRFLIDVAERGPEDLRARALEAAVALSVRLCDEGVSPSGEVAGVVVPAEASLKGRVASIRRLDIPAELVRLTALTGDERFEQTALRALSDFEFLHAWGGAWDSIDPALDDDYGHYGARSIAMAAANPSEPYLAELALSGFRHLTPMWERTLRHGGFVAADQVRAWGVFVRLAEVMPEHAPRVIELLDLAVRAHWKGEQDSSGAWVDVSHHRWNPKLMLEVGDLPGAPANLLEGLALAHRVGVDRELTRARFVAVLRSTREAYAAPFGLLPTRPQAKGSNRSGGELRMAVGVVAMLLELEGL